MGVVWRARDDRLERVVAIKQLLLLPGLTDRQRQDARRRALREARIAARLHHPNAIVVFDVVEHDGDPWLVMEYLPSRSLAAVLAERGSMPVHEVAAFGSQIADALAAAHASGIVHRDIKPGNILLADTGLAKITDFGIARAIGDITVTQSGNFAGTPAYLAPEVARGKEPTPASDVFSFGATLYDAVEGGPPFPERQNQLALLYLVAEGKVQPPQQSGALTPLLTQLLRIDPAERPSMAEASELLAEVAGSRALRPALTTATPRTLSDFSPVAPAVPISAPEVSPVVENHPRTVLAAPQEASLTPARHRFAQAIQRKRLIWTIIAALIVIVSGVVIVVGITSASSSNTGQTAGQSSNVNQPPVSGPSTSKAPTTSSNSSGPIDWTAAGKLVISYYSSLANPQTSWVMLTANGQQYFAGAGAFQQYWSQFSSVSAAHAYGVTPNADGSVNVPVDVTYDSGAGSQQKHMVIRVVKENGQLLIDSDTHIS